ncbi:MAG: hypothetical protein IJG47_11230 [Microbacterium sp.]|nr:hypothetical protein [Microbacterium sp.]
MTKKIVVAVLAGIGAVLLLAGCAGPSGVGAELTPTVTPTAACPQVEGVDLPPECAPYDPEQAMDLNDRYRDRMEIDSATHEASAAVVETLRIDLEGLRTAGTFTVDTVRAALTDAGLPDAQVREDYGDVLFGVGGVDGGCVFGEVTEEGVTVDIGGYILDGGCLPAQ